MDESEIAVEMDAPAPAHDTAVDASHDGDRLLIRLVLAQTPEQRLRGLANAAEFFAIARRV